MGSRGSGYKREQREEEPWWAQQDAERQANSKSDADRQQSGSNIEHIVGPDGTGYLVDTVTGEMWRDTEVQPSKKPPEPEPQSEPERREPEETQESTNPDPFSQERKDNALWTKDKKKVDSVLRQSAGDLYPNFDKATKDAFSSYTGSGYVSINSALGNDTVGDGYLKNKIDRLTEALDKAELPVDMWLQRGVRDNVAKIMFGSGFSVDSIQQMIDNGTIIDNKPFMSTAGAKGEGFNGSVVLNIYAPKGTKAIYAEPFSTYGGGQKSGWDGKSGQSHYSSEFEVIVQRGAQLRPLKVSENNGHMYIDMEIIGFKYDK